MGRVKQTARRSQFAVAEDQLDGAAPNSYVETETADVEINTHDRLNGSAEFASNSPLQQMTGTDTKTDLTAEDVVGQGAESCVQSDGHVSEYTSFEYDDDDIDGDFEDDAADSDYEENPTRSRRSKAKPAMSNKPAKSNVTSATTTKRTQTVRPSITGASGTRKSRVNSNGPVPRALRKAQHDVERKLSRGQPSAEDDRPLRCLPYRTLNRAPKRELMRWNEDTYLHTLLATMWVLETRDIDVPWDEIAAVVHPGATGEAFKQALTKLRNRRVKEDLPVPPLRPGKGKSRGVCEEELEIMVALARSTRNKNAGRIEASSTTGNKEKGNAKAPWKQSSRAVNANDSELGFADMTVSRLVFCTILLPNALSSSLWAVTSLRTSRMKTTTT
ncbi:hypothetical protein B0J12DRAFT_79911 [Macrophomina phaseolina]|uniref:Uncharacterized protein n=1 Tax=Macrophomina phaseolina TaxID=35725 RepID=A0ABQ8GC67_9PEZI|nr:hypothetical protein B0J12DRAFT_79911 [Macrophomina phaseolina]